MQKLHSTLAGAAMLSLAAIGVAAPSATGAEDVGAAGVEAGDGSLVIAGTDTPFVPQGFNSVGVLYPEMYQELCDSINLADDIREQLSDTRDAMVNHTERELRAMQDHWNADAVRFQVSQGAMAYEAAHGGGNPYTNDVLNVVAAARDLGLIVVVSVQTQGYGCTPHVDGAKVKMPNDDTVTSWELLAPVFSGDKGVILEVFNEPQSKRECDLPTNWSWPEWSYGCDGVPSGGTGDTGDLGMVDLSQQVRAMAPDNVLLLDGDNNGGKFNDFVPPSDLPNNVAYAPHTYFYADGPTGNSLGEGWDARFGHLQESGEALLVTEWNTSASCKAFDLAEVLVRDYLPAHQIGLFVHSWDSPAAILVDDKYNPVDSVAKCPENTGASLAYEQFWAQA